MTITAVIVIFEGFGVYGVEVNNIQSCKILNVQHEG